MYDRLAFDPDTFREFGFHIVTGKQGSGKTVTVAYLLLWFRKMYPKLKIKTNFGYEHQDGEINHWRDIVASENGIYGEIDVIDEVHSQDCLESCHQCRFNHGFERFEPRLLTVLTIIRSSRKIFRPRC